MERRDHVRDAPEVVVDGGVLHDQSGQSPVVWHATHDNEVVTDLTVWTGEIGHAEIDIGRKSPVELNLALAHRQPCRLCAEVEESQVDGFLDLVGEITHEQHDRAVRLPGPKIRQLTCPGRAGHRTAVPESGPAGAVCTSHAEPSSNWFTSSIPRAATQGTGR